MHSRYSLLPMHARHQCSVRSRETRFARAAVSYICPARRSAGAFDASLVLKLQHAAGLYADLRFAAQTDRFGRKPGGALRRNRLSLKASSRAQGAQGAYPPAMPRLPIKAADHPVDHVFPRATQHLEHIGMRRTRVVVKELDPPIALAADFS